MPNRAVSLTSVTFRPALVAAAMLVLVACAMSKPDKVVGTGERGVCKDPRPQICAMDYRPVCATRKNGTSKTYANGCGACADVSVQSWVEGPCPK